MTRSRHPRKALVLGDDTRSFLGVVRSLGRAGIAVHVAWCPERCETLHSRYVAQVHALPPYNAEDASWREALVALMQRERFDLVIPCNDPCLYPLQRHRAELEPHGRIYLLEDSTFAAVTDKFRMNELARAAGVCVPREWVVRSPSELGALRAELVPPVVLKPRSSHDAATVGRRRQVLKARDWAEAERLLAKMLGHGPVAVQEHVTGYGAGVELLLERGKPLLEFQHVRLHEPPLGGGSSYRMGVPIDGALRDAAVALLAPLDYTGVAMVEFKVDPRSGSWAFIEVNGRFWGSLPLALASGADFPYALFELLVEGCAPSASRVREGLRCRNWRQDAWWFAQNFRAVADDPLLVGGPPLRDLAASAWSALTLRERSDTFAVDDPGPALAELRIIGGKIFGSIGRRLRRRALATEPMRRRLERNARRALGQARSVLFVCKGNICRSPFADRLARVRWPSVERVGGAGYYPKPHRPAPDNACLAATRWRVDLTTHRSRALTRELLASSDVVFVFDHENRATLLRDFRVPRSRVHFLGALSRQGPLEIEDPFGRDIKWFEKTYSQIAEAIAAGAAVCDPTVDDASARNETDRQPRAANRAGAKRPRNFVDAAADFRHLAVVVPGNTPTGS